jgi:flagellin
MAALESLNLTQEMLNTTQNAVATGQKVASAADNPAVYAISQTMNADIAGLSAVSDSLSFGSSVLSTASSASSKISDQLQTLQQTVTQGSQTGIDPTTINNQIKAIVTNIQQFAASATFNGVNLLDSAGVGVTSGTMNVVQDVHGSTIQVGNQNVLTALGLGAPGTLQITTGGIEVNTGSMTAALANGDSITLSDGKNNWQFVLSDGSTAPAAQPANTTGGVNQQILVNFAATDSTSARLGELVSAMQSSGFTAQVDNSGNLHASGNGIVAGSSAVSLGGVTTVNTDSNVATVINTVSNAITAMNKISATLGATTQQVQGMQDFTKSLSDALTAGVGALTDADMAAESAKLQSLQTKQQLAIQSLAIANAQPQVLLSLFR